MRMDVRAMDDIAAVAKMRIEPMMALPDEIRKAIDRNYTIRGEIEEGTDTSADSAVREEAEPEEFVSAEAEAPALRKLSLLIQQAVRKSSLRYSH